MLKRIALTYSCNLDCPYCYAKENDKRKFIRVKDFEYLVSKIDGKRIFLLGGEPTLHPNFNELIDILKKRGIKASLFTNGLFDSSKFNNNFPEVIDTCVVNYEVLKSGKKDKLIRFKQNIDFIKNSIKYVHLSYNYLDDSFDRSLIEFCLEKDIKQINFSPTVPNLENTNSHISKEELQKKGKGILHFVELCKSNNIRVNILFPLPFCMFNKEDRTYLMENAGLKFDCKCGFGIINPDLSTYPCPVLSLKGPSIDQIKNSKQVNSFFKKKIEYLKWEKPLFDFCRDCPLSYKKICQGACLSYKIK